MTPEIYEGNGGELDPSFSAFLTRQQIRRTGAYESQVQKFDPQLVELNKVHKDRVCLDLGSNGYSSMVTEIPNHLQRFERALTRRNQAKQEAAQAEASRQAQIAEARRRAEERIDRFKNLGKKWGHRALLAVAIMCLGNPTDLKVSNPLNGIGNIAHAAGATAINTASSLESDASSAINWVVTHGDPNIVLTSVQQEIDCIDSNGTIGVINTDGVNVESNPNSVFFQQSDGTEESLNSGDQICVTGEVSSHYDVVIDDGNSQQNLGNQWDIVGNANNPKQKAGNIFSYYINRMVSSIFRSSQTDSPPRA